MRKVAIQGARGSFHEIAAKKYFGNDCELVCCETFDDVFTALRTGFVDMAVTAIVNSRFGAIDQVYRQLIKSHIPPVSKPFWIHGEVFVQVEQCLLGVSGASLSDIREVHSQAPALGQCSEFLSESLPEVVLIEQDDTALSAKLVAEWADVSKAAIASRVAAELYGLEVLASSIQDDNENLTRFLVLSTEQAPDVDKSYKTSLLLRTDHTPGALARALTIFSDRNINLAYIQSIPIPDTPFQYRFYIELDPAQDAGGIDNALNGLKNAGYEINIMGRYLPDVTVSNQDF